MFRVPPHLGRPEGTIQYSRLALPHPAVSHAAARRRVIQGRHRIEEITKTITHSGGSCTPSNSRPARLGWEIVCGSGAPTPIRRPPGVHAPAGTTSGAAPWPPSTARLIHRTSVPLRGPEGPFSASQVGGSAARFFPPILGEGCFAARARSSAGPPRTGECAADPSADPSTIAPPGSIRPGPTLPHASLAACRPARSPD